MSLTYSKKLELLLPKYVSIRIKGDEECGVPQHNRRLPVCPSWWEVLVVMIMTSCKTFRREMLVGRRVVDLP